MDSVPRPNAETAPEQDKIAVKLATGLIQLYDPHIQKFDITVSELICKQNKIEKDMIEENNNFSENALKSTQEIMNSIKMYRDKANMIKKQMITIHQKTRNLKKRSAFLQEFKAKELEDKIQRRHHEQALIATNSSEASSSNKQLS